MKKLFQNLGNGETTISNVAAPVPGAHEVIIASSLSLISAGTERMLVEFGKASLVSKARQQPERVKMVLDKVRTDGLVPTYKAVKSKLDQPIPLGYSNVGIVTSIGSQVSSLKVGERVISNGSHAELVKVSENLCEKVPDNVGDETAVFTVVASIGLQGIRLANPTLGETVAVIGVGLIGLLTVQLLVAQGCRVIAIDFDQSKLELASSFGAEVCNLSEGEDPVAVAHQYTSGRGIDAVLITAATTSNDPVSQAAKMSRKRGRIVLVGVTGLSLDRADFYEKELSFQVSCSYGPGRYDKEYEELGRDYPVGFVRWTERRNFEAVLNLMSLGRITTSSLLTHRFKFEDAENAYKTLSAEKGILGIAIKYESAIEERLQDVISLAPGREVPASTPSVALIGVGNYASAVLIPALSRTSARLHTLVSRSGNVSDSSKSAKIFERLSSNLQNVWEDESVNSVFIATRHDSHSELVVRSLNAGKNVFVEKPLCLDAKELNQIEEAYQLSDSLLMVGFNRRFSPLVLKMADLLESDKAPKSLIMTVNAGALPEDHWALSQEQGGGRILGEACHFIDLLRFLAQSPIIGYSSVSMDSPTQDTQTLNLNFEDGSIGTIHYFANGDKSFPKERLEVFSSGRILQMDNYKTLLGYGWPSFKKLKVSSQDKGQDLCVSAFISAVEKGSMSPIPIEEILEVSRVAIELSKN